MSASLHPHRHSLLDDAQAVLTATAFVSLGLGFLRQGHLLTGGTVGIALLLARVTPLSFGQLFIALNLPFFWLGVRQMGWRFTLNTFVSIVLVSVASDHLDQVLHLDRVQPVYGAVMGGALTGTGILMLIRHRACLGGFNILALWLQERHGVRAGVFQAVVDSVVVVASWFVVSPFVLALSILGAVALNFVLAVNHRPGRYLGT
ncbi:MAG TPA: YitT family protein [Anaeromyxobacter sp.]|nr:YitT family protein [Anaeromyxobacter sp.]